jgi:hypothetical protein
MGRSAGRRAALQLLVCQDAPEGDGSCNTVALGSR